MIADVCRRIQRFVVGRNNSCIQSLLSAWYSQGLRFLLARLSAITGVIGLYGTGSYFKDRALLGHSDIDLIILLDDDAPSILVQHAIYRCYTNLRRIFPFIGSWEEQRDNVILLSELRSKHASSRSLRVRLAMGDVRHLWGAPLPECEGCSAIEYLREIDVLLRSAFLSARSHGYQAIFWERHFRRLARLAAELGLEESEQAIEAAEKELDLLSEPRTLFKRGVKPGAFFERLLSLAAQTFAEFHTFQTQEEEALSLALSHEGGLAWGSIAARQERIERIIRLSDIGDEAAISHQPLTLGYAPRMFYSWIDEPVSLVSCTGDALSGLARLKQNMREHAQTGDTVFVRLKDLLFVLFRDESFVDVQVVNPLLHAPAYARLNTEANTTIPPRIYEQLCEEADREFARLSAQYNENTNSVKKESYACLYIDDDREVIRDAYHILRAYFLREGPELEFLDTGSLTEYLVAEHPASAQFFRQLEQYYRYLTGRSDTTPESRNLYRLLHIVMHQLLAGAKEIAVDTLLQNHLSISVGVITRNRAEELRELLQSLCRQSRMADEIVVVDNGSTDATKTVVESFEKELPISYEYYATPGIPQARNTVLGKASGDVIAFTDDDCVVSEEWLAAVERAFLRYDAVGIVGGEVHHTTRNEQVSAVDRYYEMFHNVKA